MMVSGELWEIIGPATVACLMIALTHAPLGIEVLRRGIIFIDLAIAQIAALGALAVNTLIDHPPWWSVQCAALGAALGAAFAFHKSEQLVADKQEALIGCFFVISASLALLLVANLPHGGDEIQHLLSGQILFATWRDVLLHLPIYLAITAIWFLLATRARESPWFYIIFAIAITSSVQLVGVYVVFASLIMPALAAHRSPRKHLVAWCSSVTAVLLGLTLSIIADAPAGPMIVLSFALVSGILAAIVPKIPLHPCR